MFNFETSGRTKIAGGIVGALGLLGACYYYFKLKKVQVKEPKVNSAPQDVIEEKETSAN